MSRIKNLARNFNWKKNVSMSLSDISLHQQSSYIITLVSENLLKFTRLYFNDKQTTFFLVDLALAVSNNEAIPYCLSLAK